MSNGDAPRLLVAVNSAEWLNLCARHEIRLQKRRAVHVATQPSLREMERVFALAPYTKLDSALDLFVLELKPDWTSSKNRHRVGSSELLLLSLGDVVSHHPVATEHADYYRNIASRHEVGLKEAIFEESWRAWIFNETVDSSLHAANALQARLGIAPSISRRTIDGYKWEDLARVILRPSEQIKRRPGHVEQLFRSANDIADEAAGGRDTEQYYLACTIEWVTHRLNKQPMRKREIKEQLSSTLSASKQLPFGQLSESTSAAIKLLVASYPKAFTDELTPETITLLVQVTTDAKRQRLKLDNAIRMARSLRPELPSSALISFAMAVSLGVERTHQLVNALTSPDGQGIDWDQ